MRFSRIGERAYNAVLTYPNGSTETFLLRGDEWQIDVYKRQACA